MLLGEIAAQRMDVTNILLVLSHGRHREGGYNLPG